jgi:hypothetical protein
LLAFAMVLILLGGFTSILVSIFGFLLLFPALFAPSKKPLPKQPYSEPVVRRTGGPRWSPSPLQPAESEAVQPPSPAAAAEVPHLAMSAESSSSSALFPNTMFPALSLATPATVGTPTGEATPSRPEPRDELLEFGVLLAVLRMLSG